MRQHIEDAYMKPCGPYRACDNCPASPASLKVFVAQGTCNSDTPDPPVWLVVSGIRDNRDVPEQPQYQLDFEVCPASERRSHFELNVRRIALLGFLPARGRARAPARACSALGDT